MQISETRAAAPDALRRIETLAEIADPYAAIFCDVWGVVHDGERKHAAAEAALWQARERGRHVVLLTNSPRPCDGVIAQLDGLGFARAAYDAVVTSGDATRDLIAAAGGPVFHLGPERDLDLFQGLGVDRVGEEKAVAVVASGLFDDETETPADYEALLSRLAARGLPMICANPDIVVHRGPRLIYCAGALAQEYAKRGGKVLFAGKPHRPIYEAAVRAAGLAAGAPVLAIGDGLMTDILGAQGFGVDALLITAGIHQQEFGGPDPDTAKVREVLYSRDLAARYHMASLR